MVIPVPPTRRTQQGYMGQGAQDGQAAQAGGQCARLHSFGKSVYMTCRVTTVALS
jgi:hypothetical protein